MSTSSSQYQVLDIPEVTNYLFHPRSEEGYGSEDIRYQELSIPVDEDVAIGARFYACGKNAPVLIFFHGNGEIVADYDDIGQFYQRLNINFFALDYRGYGISTGRPTVSTMMTDCHKLFNFVDSYLKENGYKGARVVMGRSLGSASAIELASANPDTIDGLIIESGFAYTLPLLRLLGINLERLGITNDVIGNDDKIARFSRPTLIIHAELDHIIPLSDGVRLYEKAGDIDKKLLKIPGANHNDILARGLEVYMKEVKGLVERSAKKHIQKSGV